MWGTQPDTGDWVIAKEIIPVSLTDHLLGTGLPSGTKGVITGKAGNKLEVEFDTGMGTTRANVSVSKCALVKRGGGKDAFLRRAGTVGTVRLALCLFLIWPLIQFAGLYWWEKRTFDGIVEEFTLAGIESAGEWIMSMIDDPVPVLAYALFIAVLSRFAFRHGS
jgi:hypothetical protein